MLDRIGRLDSIRALRGEFPVMALLGARQVGQATLATRLAQERADATRFDLEDPMAQERIRDPMLALRDLLGLVEIDEIQRAPEIVAVLRVLANRALTARDHSGCTSDDSPECQPSGADTFAGPWPITC